MLVINQSAANANLATLVLVLLSFPVAYSNLESLFFSALDRKVFLGHSWMRELINHLVLLLTLKGIQSSLLYLLSAGKMGLSAGNPRHIFCSQGEMSDAKWNSSFYLERMFARCTTGMAFMPSFLAQLCCLFSLLSCKEGEMC